ncbi:hypothetical protein ACFQ9X_17255 [Catenulispora yoronensis]
MSLALALDLPPTTALPVRVKPNSGEHVDAYIRRLAADNHMPPSVLIEILNGRIGYSSAVLRTDLLAILSGRSEQALHYALHGLPKTRSRQPAPAIPRMSSPQRPRRTHAEMRETFAAIRRDAAYERTSPSPNSRAGTASNATRSSESSATPPRNRDRNRLVRPLNAASHRVTPRCWSSWL